MVIAPERPMQLLRTHTAPAWADTGLEKARMTRVPLREPKWGLEPKKGKGECKVQSTVVLWPWKRKDCRSYLEGAAGHNGTPTCTVQMLGEKPGAAGE